MYGEGYGEEDGEGWTDTKREWGRARKGEKVKEKEREDEGDRGGEQDGQEEGGRDRDREEGEKLRRLLSHNSTSLKFNPKSSISISVENGNLSSS